MVVFWGLNCYVLIHKFTTCNSKDRSCTFYCKLSLRFFFFFLKVNVFIQRTVTQFGRRSAREIQATWRARQHRMQANAQKKLTYERFLTGKMVYHNFSWPMINHSFLILMILLPMCGIIIYEANL